MQNNFKVAIGLRSGVDVTDGKAFPVKVDVSNPADISLAPFKATEGNLGAPPNVVVYNGEHALVQYTTTQFTGIHPSHQLPLSAQLRPQANLSLYHTSNTSSTPSFSASLRVFIDPSSKDLTAGGLGAYPTIQNSLISFRRLPKGTPKVSLPDASRRHCAH